MNSKVGDYIAYRRRILDITQVELSERLARLGIIRSASTIANWETGRQVVPIEILPVLAQALDEKSVIQLYTIAGILAHLPGAEIVKLMDDLDERDRNAIVAMILAFAEQNKHK